jgi:uncharacterized protein YkwD
MHRANMPSPRPFAVAAAAIFLALPAFGEAPDLARVMSIVMEGTNRFRQEHRLATLEADSKLAATARDFADFMAKTDKYGHGADDLGLLERVRRHGYAYCLVSENIGYQFRSDGFRTAADLADGFVEGWKRSPGHRKNMMERDATEIGVAVARSAKTGRYYGVEIFARPASHIVEFAVANESEQRVDYRIGSAAYWLPRRTVRTHRECVAEPVGFQGQVLHPVNGDRLTIVEGRGSLRMTRE